MKKISLLLLVFIPFFLTAQKQEIKDRFAEYTQNGYYKEDGNNIVVSRVIENLKGDKNSIYIAVKNYFTRAYNSANDVLQTDDKESGVIIGKGYYKHMYLGRTLGVVSTYLNAYHILRIDIKDGRLRAICSIDQVEVYNGQNHHLKDVNVFNYAPFTDKRYFDKGRQMEAFLSIVDRMTQSINMLEESIKSGVITGESDSW